MNQNPGQSPAQPSQADVAARTLTLAREAEAGSYNLNPDAEFTADLVTGLIVNEKRYGYPSCPCRLAAGIREKDTDIICPCDYRDADITEYGACFCALYVSAKIAAGKQQARSIPERRPAGGLRGKKKEQTPAAPPALSVPIWRCRVCGYLCGREQPPEKCPICKVPRERFERFLG
jgi:ferredoxin-thioredoxin reductase catalytic chain